MVDNVVRESLAQLNNDESMAPADVAVVFGVDPKTVTRWAREGRIPSFKTIGGHRRFKVSTVKAMFNELTTE